MSKEKNRGEGEYVQRDLRNLLPTHNVNYYENKIFSINGEVKPGVRTPRMYTGTLLAK